MREYEASRAAFQRATELDPHLALAHLGLAGCATFTGRFAAAANHALDAVALRHNLTTAHLALGVALEQLGQTDEACQAYRVALSVDPHFGFAHWRLGRLLLKRPETAPQAWDHLEAAKRARVEKRNRVLAAREKAARFRERFDAALAQARPAWRRLESATPAGRAPERAEPASGEPILVVSGLPRSGTSLMMQMLHAAGVPLLTDGQRVADADNPEGYFEWEPIKKIAEVPERIAEADGKAVKVISMLLPALPATRRYRVLFMARPVAEVAASQAKMLQRAGKPAGDEKQMARLLGQHMRTALRSLSRSKHFRTLVVPYRALIARPEPWIEKIVAFVGTERVPHPDRMQSVIRPDLYRQRGAPS